MSLIDDMTEEVYFWKKKELIKLTDIFIVIYIGIVHSYTVCWRSIQLNDVSSMIHGVQSHFLSLNGKLYKFS